METKTELASNIEADNTSRTRKSKRARKKVATYDDNVVAEEPTKCDIVVTDDDRMTRTYLLWSLNIPLIQDSLFLNLWLIDHEDAV